VTGPVGSITGAPPVEPPATALDSRSSSPTHAHLARAPRLPPAGPWFWCALTCHRRYSSHDLSGGKAIHTTALVAAGPELMRAAR
jgi:hypothetical protein